MERKRLITLTEIAVMAGVGAVLSVFVTLRLWPQGGSVSLAMVPIVLVAYRRGWVAGVICGLLVGLFNLMTHPLIAHPVQVVLDYPLAYAALGLAGLFPVRGEAPGWTGTGRIAWGVTVAGLIRFLSHFVSGVVWFGAYAPEEFSPVLYSALYNLSYIIPDILVSILIVSLLAAKAPRLVKTG
jgi:thiamine transporter